MTKHVPESQSAQSVEQPASRRALRQAQLDTPPAPAAAPSGSAAPATRAKATGTGTAPPAKPSAPSTGTRPSAPSAGTKPSTSLPGTGPISEVPSARPAGTPPAPAAVGPHVSRQAPPKPSASPTSQPRPAQTDIPSAPPARRRDLRETSFLVTGSTQEPATKGWRGVLSRLGLRIDPSREELAEREDVRTVSQHWPGPRTVAVVNRKGGANKTPTVVMLSAILARYGGGPVLAWDNNESQGTLGWRTEQGPHASSVLDLVDSSSRLLSPESNAADLAHYVHHQAADKFDVLRSDEDDEGDHEVTAEEVDVAHRVASKYYRLIVMDSGNTSRSANWRRMIDHTNQLVVPVTAMEDRAEAARLTLQTLESRGEHEAKLARNAVVVVSESTDAGRGLTGEARKRAKIEAQRIEEGFRPFVREVVRIPYDPALVNGPIRYAMLQPATQRAWLNAAAAVARGF